MESSERMEAGEKLPLLSTHPMMQARASARSAGLIRSAHSGPIKSYQAMPSYLKPGTQGQRRRQSEMPGMFNANLSVAKLRMHNATKPGGPGDHSWVYSMLRTHSHRPQAQAYRTVILSLILLDVLAFVLMTDAPIYERFFWEFWVLEGVSSCVFFVEYALRCATIPESQRYAGMNPATARLQWVCTSEAIIDMLAFMPWILEVAAAGRLSLPNLSVLRLFRLFRILKAGPVIGAFDVVARVFYYNAEILSVSAVICGVLLLITSTALWLLKPPDDTGGDFISIPATMYLAILMLTGQGIPDGVLPWYTKMIITITAVFSVAQFAIPAAMLTWGFEAEAKRRAMKQRTQRKMRQERIRRGEDPDPVSSGSSTDCSTSTEWSEYEKAVADSDDESSDNTSGAEAGPRLDSGELERAMRIFSALDDDESGYIERDKLPRGRVTAQVREQLEANNEGKTNSEQFVKCLTDLKQKLITSERPQAFKQLLSDLEKRTLGKLATTPGPNVERFAELLEQLMRDVSGIRQSSEQMRAEIAEIKARRQASSETTNLCGAQA